MSDRIVIVRPEPERVAVAAAGARGPAGPQGEVGPAGPQGPKGDPGNVSSADVTTIDVLTQAAYDAIVTKDPAVLYVIVGAQVPLLNSADDVRVGATQASRVYLGATQVWTPPASGPLVSDTFDRADNATSLGTADTGQTWTALAGTWGIQTNRAYSSPDTPIDRQAAIESGAADVTVEVTIPVVGLNGQPAVLGRVVDGSNYWLWAWESGRPGMALYRRAGGHTLIGTYALSSLANGSSLGLRMSGTTIVGLVDGVDVLTVTDATHQTATQHGLRVYATDAPRWDNFTVAAL